MSFNRTSYILNRQDTGELIQESTNIVVDALIATDTHIINTLISGINSDITLIVSDVAALVSTDSNFATLVAGLISTDAHFASDVAALITTDSNFATILAANINSDLNQSASILALETTDALFDALIATDRSIVSDLFALFATDAALGSDIAQLFTITSDITNQINSLIATDTFNITQINALIATDNHILNTLIGSINSDITLIQSDLIAALIATDSYILANLGGGITSDTAVILINNTANNSSDIASLNNTTSDVITRLNAIESSDIVKIAQINALIATDNHILNTVIAGLNSDITLIVSDVASLVATDSNFAILVAGLISTDAHFASDIAALITTDSNFASILAANINSDLDQSQNIASLISTDASIITRLIGVESSDVYLSTQVAALIATDGSLTTDIAGLSTTDSAIVTRLVGVESSDSAKVDQINSLIATDSAIVTRLAGVESSDSAKVAYINSLIATDSAIVTRLVGVESSDSAKVTQINSLIATDSSLTSDVSFLLTTVTPRVLGLESSDTAKVAQINSLIATDLSIAKITSSNRALTYSHGDAIRVALQNLFIQVDPRVDPNIPTDTVILMDQIAPDLTTGSYTTSDGVLTANSATGLIYGTRGDVIREWSTESDSVQQIELVYNDSTPGFEGWLFVYPGQPSKKFVNFHAVDTYGEETDVFGPGPYLNGGVNYQSDVVDNVDYLYRIGYTELTTTLKQYQVVDFSEPPRWIVPKPDIGDFSQSVYGTMTITSGSDITLGGVLVGGKPTEILHGASGIIHEINQNNVIKEFIIAISPSQIQLVNYPGLSGEQESAESFESLSSDNHVAFKLTNFSDLTVYHGNSQLVSDVIETLGNIVINVQTSDGGNTNIMLENTPDTNLLILPMMIAPSQAKNANGNFLTSVEFDALNRVTRSSNPDGIFKLTCDRPYYAPPDVFGDQILPVDQFDLLFHMTSDTENPYVGFYMNSDVIWRVNVDFTSSDNTGLIQV